jgi:hypothetical protein
MKGARARDHQLMEFRQWLGLPGLRHGVSFVSIKIAVSMRATSTKALRSSILVSVSQAPGKSAWRCPFDPTAPQQRSFYLHTLPPASQPASNAAPRLLRRMPPSAHDVGGFDRLMAPGRDTILHQKLVVDVEPIGHCWKRDQHLPRQTVRLHTVCALLVVGSPASSARPAC